MDDIVANWNSETLIPLHRAENWFNRWATSGHKKHERWVKIDCDLNEEAVIIMRERLEVIIKRFNIKAENPSELTMVLNGILTRYNGLIYEENGIIMEIDLFNDMSIDDKAIEPYLFGIGDTPIFNTYLYEHYPEILI